VTVSEVCRRHALAASVFYRWRAVAQGGSAVALKRDAQRTARKDDPEARRYIVHHKLLMSLEGRSVAIELQAALKAAKDLKPRVVHDHGSEFVNRDVAAVIKTHNLHRTRRNQQQLWK
jgi:hypothetical protein